MGIKSAMGDAGVSSQSFERLVNRMSQRVASDYASMMRNIRTDNTTAEESALRVTKAQEDLSQSFNKTALSTQEASLNSAKARERYLESLGVPASTFAAQDQLLKQQEAGLALDKAIQAEREANFHAQHANQEKQLELDKAEEAQREQELRSIPKVTAALKEGMEARKQQPLVGDTDLGTLMKSVENMARGGKEGPAAPVDVFKTMMESFRTGAIGEQQGVALLRTELGQRAMGAGSGAGTAPEDIFRAAQAGEFTEARTKAREDVFKAQGIGAATPEQEQQARRESVSTTRRNEAISREGSALGRLMSKPLEQFNNGTTRLLEFGNNVVHGLATGEPASQWKYQEGKPPDWRATVAGALQGGAAAGIAGVIGGIPLGPGGMIAGGLAGLFGGGIFGAIRGAGQRPGEYSPDLMKPAAAAGGADAAGSLARVAGSADAAAASLERIAGISTPANNPNMNQTPNTTVAGSWQAAPASSGVSSQFVPSGQWRGGLIRGFDVGGGVDPFDLASQGSGAGGTQLAQADPRAYSVISGAHQSIEEAGFDPTARREMQNMWSGGFIPGFAGGGHNSDWFDAQLAAAHARYLAHPTPEAWAEYQAKVADLQNLRSNEADQEARGSMQSTYRQLGLDPSGHIPSGGLWGGGIPGFAVGSIHGPGTGTSDSILARLSNGEFVMKDAAVRNYGVNFMHALNDMQIPAPKYELGGMVPLSSIPRFAAGGGIEHQSILNLHIGDQEFRGLKAPEAVARQLKTFAIDQQTTSTGRKPSWTT